MSTKSKYDQFVPEKLFKAIVFNDTPTTEEIKLAYSDIEEKFTPNNPNYVGSFEHGLYDAFVKKWESTGSIERTFKIKDPLYFESISFMASLESVPMNFYEGGNVLVLGPFDTERLEYLLADTIEIK